MGIYNALFTGASGLTAFGEGVRVIGDNIANVNTLGFKSQQVNFADVLGQTVNVSRSNIANQVGNGVRIGAISRDQAQGSVQSTTSATDMAINGSGMFVLKDPASGQTQYTRAGAFLIDSGSNLINGQAFEVQGWALDSAGNPQGSVTSITAANVAANAQATTSVDVGVNLDATAANIVPASFDPTDPTTYTSKSDVTVFDSLGSLHNISTYFVKLGMDSAVPANAVWDWHVTVDGGDVIGGTAGTATEINESGAITIPPAAGHSTPSVVAAVAVAGNKATLAAGVIQAAGANVTGLEITNDAATFSQAATFTVNQDAAGLITSITSDVALTDITDGTVIATAGSNLLSTAQTVVGAVTVAGMTFTSAAVTSGTGVAAVRTTSAATAGAADAIAAGAVSTMGSQTLSFSPVDGSLVNEVAPTISLPWASSSAGVIAFNFGAATTLDASAVTGTGLDGALQLAGAGATRFMTADGYAAGFLDHMETDSTGRINGIFTNGQRRPLFQVALAKFPNEAVLSKLGNNMQGATIAPAAGRHRFHGGFTQQAASQVACKF